MNELEKELHAALRRKDPPPGFTGKVLSKIPEHSRGWREALASLFRPPLLRRAVAGICICAIMAAAVMYQFHTRQKVADEERAKAQVIQALYIASTELNAAYDKVAGWNTTTD